MSRILSTGGGGGGVWPQADTFLRQTPPSRHPLSPGRHPPEADIPLGRHPLGRHSLGRRPPQADTPLPRRPLQRTYESYWNAFLCFNLCVAFIFFLLLSSGITTENVFYQIQDVRHAIPYLLRIICDGSSDRFGRIIIIIIIVYFCFDTSKLFKRFSFILK